MRINRLDLTRYGIFSDYSIDFGSCKADVPDLHIIYGENEAGKSTALAAFLDLLFGIDVRSRYNFLHPYEAMRIGGELEIDGHPHEFSRIKRRQNSLLGNDGKPVADNIILGDLGGIDRASYTTMFSLDDDTLEAGGESILASEGDLGQLLFSASSGLSTLGRTLVGLQTEADGFYKYRGRGGELSKLKARLGELKAERELIDTLASEYAKLVKTRDRTAEQYGEAMGERGRIQTRTEELKRQLAMLPRLVELRGVRESLAPLAGIPDAPLGWNEELPKLQRDEVELGTRADGIYFEIERISEELDDIVIDEAILGLAPCIDLLTGPKARYVTAEKDLPERRFQQKEANLGILGILARIGCEANTEPESLLLGAQVTGTLRELMEVRSGIETAAVRAKEESGEARRRLVQVREKLKAAGGAAQPGDVADGCIQRLVSAVGLAQNDDHATRLRLAERSRRENLDSLGEDVHWLLPWTGDGKDLRELYLPDASTIERWRNSISEAQRRRERHDDDIERLTKNRDRLTAEIEAVSRVAGVMSDREAASVRAVREEAWSEHKRTLDAESAGAFEAALRRDDLVTTSRVGNAAEVARLNQNSRTLAASNAELKTALGARDGAVTELKVISGEIAVAVRAMVPSFPEDMSLAQLEMWLEKREKALQSFAAVKKSDNEIAEAVEDGERVRSRLIEAATTTGIAFEADASTDQLISLARSVIDRQTEINALRSEVSEWERDVDARERREKRELAAEADWARSWAEICAGCWLGERNSIPTVREILKAIDELGPLIEKRSSLADRIQKMEDDQRRFAAEVETLAKESGVNEPSPPLDLAARLEDAVNNTRAAQTAHGAASTRLADAKQRKREIAENREIHERRKTEMIEHFGVGSLLEVDARLRDIEKRTGLQNQANNAERDIMAALSAPSIEMAEDMLDDVDRGAVENEIAELQGRFENQDGRAQELFTERSKASDQIEAVGGDEAVAKIEEKRGLVLLEIEEGAVRYLRLRLGVIAAEQALRIYRDRHRSSMMDRASDAFRTISREAYKGLRTQPEKDSEVLIAVGANDGSKIASALSKGTRFQLYLALRVAGYHEFVRSRRPVPFLADDIMETFDDFRAEEAFRLFAQMAEVGQVIYLTHHKHLCEIARRVCNGVKVHELSPGAP